MTAATLDARCPDPVDLLDRAVGYARRSLIGVTDIALDRATPCAQWDLRELLHHMDDSLAVLVEAAELGHVALVPEPDGSADGMVRRLQIRACALLAAWSAAVPDRITIGDGSIPGGMLAGIGALEMSVHSWDVAIALGGNRPIPTGLAIGLLPLVDVLVDPEDRPERFALPVPAAPTAGPGDRLVAALGRTPPGVRGPRGAHGFP